MRNLIVSLFLSLATSLAAQAACDPALGWPAGKACRDADNVGVRVSGQDVSLQESIDDGSLPSSIQAGAAPQTVTVANLPTCNAAAEGIRRVVSDALTDSQCTVAGGSANAPCVCRNSAWVTEVPGLSTLGAIADQANGGALECDATLGICPNPRSTLILDTRPLFAAARGGNRDDDGSMYGGTPTANATSDFINSSTQVATAAGGTGYVLVSSVADAFDLLSCRDSSTFAPCSTGGTCTSIIPTTASPVPWVWCDGTTGLCQGQAATSYAGCNTSTHNLTTVNPRLTTNAGTAQLAMPDGTHPSALLSKLLAQSVLASVVEAVEYPVSDATNLISNGHLTSAATGWTEAGTGTLAHAPALAVPGDFQNANFYNGGLQLTARGASTDAILTPTMATVAGRWYVARGFARLNSVGTEDIVVQAIDASAGTAFPTQQAYLSYGSTHKKLTGGASDLDRECYGGCFFIVKWLATDTDSQISISSSSGTGNLYADDWIAMPAPTERLGLTPLFPGGVALRLEGDSRANESAELGGAIDAAITAGVPRPNFGLLDALYPDNVNALNGRGPDDVVGSEAFSSLTFASSGGRYVLVFLGLNDVSGQTPAAIASNLVSITRQIRKVGGRPMLVLEPPYRGNTTTTTCENGVENCTTTIDELADLLKHSATGALHQ
jgi:lysophospholipase L1-like esterase